MVRAVLTRFFTLLLLLVTIETGVFAYTYQDLISLSGDPERISSRDEASLRELAASALARRHLTRHHLETLAEALRRRQLVDDEVRTLERLHRQQTTDEAIELRLADAYRRAGRLDEASAIYQRFIAEAQQ